MTDGERTAEFIYLIGILVLVVSALMVRRVPIGRGLQMFAGWVILFLAAFVAFALKDPLIEFAQQLVDERKAETTGVQVGSELRVRQALDGHFWVDAEVNGKSVRFLIDSGATTTSLSEVTAKRVGVRMRGGLPALVQTANGVVPVERGRIETLEVGQIRRTDMAVHVSPAFGNMNVLGMNFLSSLSGWTVKGRWLIMTA